MNQAIQEAARTLGQQIMQSETYINMQRQEEAALADEALQSQYREYSLARQQLQELSLQDEPDPGEMEALRMEIERLAHELQQTDTMTALTNARNAFGALMARVNDELQLVLNPVGEDDEDGCQANASADKGRRPSDAIHNRAGAHPTDDRHHQRSQQHHRPLSEGVAVKVHEVISSLEIEKLVNQPAQPDGGRDGDITHITPVDDAHAEHVVFASSRTALGFDDIITPGLTHEKPHHDHRDHQHEHHAVHPFPA